MKQVVTVRVERLVRQKVDLGELADEAEDVKERRAEDRNRRDELRRQLLAAPVEQDAAYVELPSVNTRWRPSVSAFAARRQRK